MNISDKIKKQTLSLEERGLSPDSFWLIFFTDGSSISEEECNWSDISVEANVKYLEGTKTVYKCIYPVRDIIIRHNELQTKVEVPTGCAVYQAIRGQATLLNGQEDKQIVGRCVGIIKDGRVIEERVLNCLEGVIQGWKN